jgi:hypothetical protein
MSKFNVGQTSTVCFNQGAFHVNATPKVLKYNFFYAKKFEVSRQLIINLKFIPKKQDDIKSKKCRYDVNRIIKRDRNAPTS